MKSLCDRLLDIDRWTAAQHDAVKPGWIPTMPRITVSEPSMPNESQAAWAMADAEQERLELVKANEAKVEPPRDFATIDREARALWHLAPEPSHAGRFGTESGIKKMPPHTRQGRTVN